MENTLASTRQGPFDYNFGPYSPIATYHMNVLPFSPLHKSSLFPTFLWHGTSAIDICTSPHRGSSCIETCNPNFILFSFLVVVFSAFKHRSQIACGLLHPVRWCFHVDGQLMLISWLWRDKYSYACNHCQSWGSIVKNDPIFGAPMHLSRLFNPYHHLPVVSGFLKIGRQRKGGRVHPCLQFVNTTMFTFSQLNFSGFVLLSFVIYTLAWYVCNSVILWFFQLIQSLQTINHGGVI